MQGKRGLNIIILLDEDWNKQAGQQTNRQMDGAVCAALKDICIICQANFQFGEDSASTRGQSIPGQTVSRRRSERFSGGG